MNIEKEYEIFEAGEYLALAHEIASTHTLVEKETGRVVAVFYNDYDLESCVEQMQARAAKVPEGQFLLPREFLEEYAELLRDSKNHSELYKMVILDQVKAMLNKEEG